MADQIIPDKYRGSVEYAQVKAELICAAGYHGVTTYQTIARIMGLPDRGSHMGRETGYMLGEISEDEVRAGRPMLSAIAVGVNGLPGDGFAGIARDLGLLAQDADEQTFWKEQCDAVYKTWARKP